MCCTTDHRTGSYCVGVSDVPPSVTYPLIPIGMRLEGKMESETQGYVFARSHSLIHYLKISVKRQKIESRIQGNTPKFNNIKLICFLLFILYMGLPVYVPACLYCVCSLLHIHNIQHQSGPLCLTVPPPHS
jgi:hypothetical protein